MNKWLKKAIILLFIVFALFGVVAGLTEANTALLKIRLDFFVLACLFFIVSIVLWLICWAYLLKKHFSGSYLGFVFVGLSCVYGALTPVQLGADTLRSIRAKEYFGISYSQSISASFIIKGIKFLILSLFTANIFLLFLFNLRMSSFLFYAFLSGFFVVLLASFLFLIPLKKSFGLSIAGFFGFVSNYVPFFSLAQKFFEKYSSYLEKLELKSFVIIFVCAFLSWCFEFFALQFSFLSLGISLSFHSLLIFMVLVSILERTPFLPRGIGLVELVGYYFLAFPSLIAGASLTVNQIGGVLIVYGLVRLVVPTVLSILVALIVSAKMKKLS